jgi:hypothetical protein
LRERITFGVPERPERVVPRSRHIARCPSYARESQTTVDVHRSTRFDS